MTIQNVARAARQQTRTAIRMLAGNDPDGSTLTNDPPSRERTCAI